MIGSRQFHLIDYVHVASLTYKASVCRELDGIMQKKPSTSLERTVKPTTQNNGVPPTLFVTQRPLAGIIKLRSPYKGERLYLHVPV